MRLLDVVPLEPLLRRRYYPAEVYRFWDHYYPGFSEPCRDLRRDDVTERARRELPPALRAATGRSRPRLVVKITGWPRMAFLHELYPSARFIHVFRDGRAVANSTLNVWFWRGWGGPTRWRWGELSNGEKEVWERHNRSFVSLAGIQWVKLMSSFRDVRSEIPSEQLLEISYEDLCADPEATLRKATDFADIAPSPRFLRRVNSFDLVNQNNKWKHDLTATQQATLEDSVGVELAAWGYV